MISHIDNCLELAYSYHQLTKEGTMPNIQKLSGSDSSKRIFANLRSAIDKSLAKKIASLSDQIRGIENLQKQSDMVRILRNEILNLQDQLSDVRKRAL